MYKNGLSFNSTSLHISHEKLNLFSPYAQNFAIWSDSHLSNDEAYTSYRKCVEYSKNNGFAFSCINEANRMLLLSVEDARLLNGSLHRLEQLKTDGVISLTLSWKGDSCICGGWDTSLPLTTFGIDVIKHCYEYKIAVDLSHSSYEAQVQALNFTERYETSPIFSHSNSYAVCRHKRNISDEIAKEIASRNGLIGLSLCCEHLASEASATIFSLLEHAYRFLDLGCENCLAFGCDFDGVSTLPHGINSVADMVKVYSLFTQEFGSKITDAVFFNNSFVYFSKLLEGR